MLRTLGAAELKRIDDKGRAFKGSQLQVQIYVNRRAGELNTAIQESVPELANSTISWRAPLERDGFVEPRDADFLLALGLERLSEALEDFWPRRGPVWDALATVDLTGVTPGVLLLEGKSYPAEMESTCRAKGDSRAQITATLTHTQRALGSDGDLREWLEVYYQLANRLAHLVWLRAQGVPTWLVLASFVDDADHIPTSEAQWNDAFEDVGRRLDIDLASLDGIGHAGLVARPRSGLLETH